MRAEVAATRRARSTLRSSRVCAGAPASLPELETDEVDGERWRRR
jgi:hypothetical protein